MGEETRQFASRFTRALDLLAGISSGAGLAAARGKHGAELDAAVADALDAVAALHEADTSAVKDWGERRAQVLARVAELREALARGGAQAVGPGAAALVELLGGPPALTPEPTDDAVRAAVRRGAKRGRR
jgi:hypothetical protein